MRAVVKRIVEGVLTLIGIGYFVAIFAQIGGCWFFDRDLGLLPGSCGSRECQGIEARLECEAEDIQSRQGERPY
jgi:hypothetical protein